MVDDFLYVLENYPNADLSKKEDREVVANALSNIMCEHHIVTYTDLTAVTSDAKMTNWIEYCNTNTKENPEDTIVSRGL
jgi:hypothetical protein